MTAPRPAGTVRRRTKRGRTWRRRPAPRKVTDTVANAAPHTAHNTLVSAAFTLGRLVAGGEFTDDEARSTLHIVARQRRIPTHEADDAITDGLEAGGLSPRRLADRAA